MNCICGWTLIHSSHKSSEEILRSIYIHAYRESLTSVILVIFFWTNCLILCLYYQTKISALLKFNVCPKEALTIEPWGKFSDYHQRPLLSSVQCILTCGVRGFLSTVLSQGYQVRRGKHSKHHLWSYLVCVCVCVCVCVLIWKITRLQPW